MIDDVYTWSNLLPNDLVAIAGVPRSGILPATLLALHRNIHLVSIADLQQEKKPWLVKARRQNRPIKDGRILVVDDSISSGATMKELQAQLPFNRQIEFGAVYFTKATSGIVNHAYRHVAHPRCFEWNLFHCHHMEASCLDMDGVICEDWFGNEDESVNSLTQYKQHIDMAAPKFLPTYPVLAIVTARLEKYRPETTAWLRRHKIRFYELVMSPHSTAEARRRAGDHGSQKANIYQSLPHARLFIESDSNQAQRIANLTGRSVLCTADMRLHN